VPPGHAYRLLQRPPQLLTLCRQHGWDNRTDANGICMASTDERTLMLDDESDYDIRCQQLRQDNTALLGDFSRWLKKAGLGAATIRTHCTNLDFYLNHFLLYADTLTPADGVCYVGEFLGDWFIHKAMWSNKTTVKANAASLKKFYAFMAERELIKPEEFASLKQQIKDKLPDWLGAVERYNDPDVDFEDVWPI
jgi:hypothetical protein